MPAVVAQQYTYTHPSGLGFGEHSLNEATSAPITAEMKELDMADGTVVTVEALDESEGDSNGWPIVNWTDSKGLDRMTTIDPVTFDEYFVES